MNEDAPKFRQTKRAAAWLPRILIPRGECTDCIDKRNRALAMYRSLRKELPGKFSQFRGEDTGMTIGVSLRHKGIVWKDLVVVICIIQVTT